VPLVEMQHRQDIIGLPAQRIHRRSLHDHPHDSKEAPRISLRQDRSSPLKSSAKRSTA